MIKGILFDMDGILFDSEVFYHDGNYEVLKRLGYEGPKDALLEGIGGTMDMIMTLHERLLNHRYTKEEILAESDKYFLEEHPIPYKEYMFKDIPETLMELKKRGYLLACCSSSPKTTIQEGLTEMGILEYFDYLVSSEDLPHPKPSPDVYLEAAKVLGLKAEECVVYEDSDMGIESGKRAGMLVIAREDKRFHQTQEKADVKIQHAKEMLAYLDKENVCRK
ncbi:MAG: HAD family phosphatase [Solobacterium sp.]|nr:HAD family phosphatase [Solobacterium sp.]